MFTVATTAFLFGAGLGCTLRVSRFMAVALVVLLVALATAGWLDALLGSAALQVGYAGGLLLRGAFPRFFETTRLDLIAPPAPVRHLSP